MNDDTAVAINTGRTAMQSGKLPDAILAYRKGLHGDPSHRGLQDDYRVAQSMVDAPHRALDAWQYRVAPGDLFIVCAASVLIAAVAAARHFTVRPRGMAGLATIATLIALCSAGVAVMIHREQTRELATPFIVVQHATALREGNGRSYPSVRDLPPGAEATLLTERGGWLQVELADGVTGWLSERDALRGD